MKRWGLAKALIVVVALSAVVGVSAAASSEPAGKSAAEKKKVNIALLTVQLNNTFTQAHIAGAKAAAKAEGNASVKVFNSNFQPAVQVRQCNDAVSSGQYNAILIQSNVGTSVVSCVRRAIAKKIKVVAIESSIGPRFDTLRPQVPGVTGSVFVTSTYLANRVLKELYRVCGSRPCKVAQLIGLAGFGFDADRDKIIDRALKARPNIEIVSRQPTSFLEVNGTKEMRTILQAHPDIDVLVTAGDQISLGAEKAIRAAGKKVGRGGIRVISNGSSKEAAAKVKSGVWESSGIMMPRTTGRLGARIAIRAVRGERTGKTEILVPDLFVKGGVLTKANVNKFKAEYASR